MAAWSAAMQRQGKRIALVPTMGALHAGHKALLDEARRRGDGLVLSIFVNPTQFGPGEDLAKYPRDEEGDLAMAVRAGVDVVFMPERAAMYPDGFQTVVQVREIEKGLCGERRPGHFAGVATVVLKLFNLVRPDVAVFGEKDFQQFTLLKRMVRDLDLPIDVVGLPTVRESDGLAMSSRNRYLSPSDRQRAPALFRALCDAGRRVKGGERNAVALVLAAALVIAPSMDRIDYLEVRDAETLEPVFVVERPAVMLVAAFIGGTRLIDNLRL